MADLGLTASDFRRATGRGLLRDEHFPTKDGEGSTLAADLEGTGSGEDGWIPEARRRTEALAESPERRRAAAVHFVYYRAFFDVYSRMSGEATRSTTEGEGSVRFDPRQAERFKALSDEHHDDFQDLMPAASEEREPQSFGPPRSRPVRVTR